MSSEFQTTVPDGFRTVIPEPRRVSRDEYGEKQYALGGFVTRERAAASTR
jgi:hypothetical protein